MLINKFFNKEDKSTNDKILLISAPNIYGDMIRPNAAIPLLSGQLKHAGFCVDCFDYTLELFDSASHKDFIEKSYKHFKKEVKLPKDKQSIDYKRTSLKIRTAEDTYKKLTNSINPHNNRIHPGLKMELYKFIQFPYTIHGKYYSMNYYDIKKQTSDRKTNFFIDFFE